MSSTLQRDQASAIAKANPKKALEKARKIKDPWFRAQALSSVARFTDGDPSAIAAQAAKAAAECDDDYKRAAVRAWEIAALAERKYDSKARKSLGEAMKLAKLVKPSSSRGEVFFLLLQAAFKIDQDQAIRVHVELKVACSIDEHWRCKRAVRDAEKMISGTLEPREFF